MEASIAPVGQKLLGERIDNRRVNNSTLETAIQLWLIDIDGSNEELIELTMQ